MRSGVVSAQPPLARPIDASACSSWPTATATDSESSARSSTMTGVMHSGTSLTDASRSWSTPTAVDDGTRMGRRQNPDGRGGRVLTEEVEHWPTPAARDHKGANGVDHLEAGSGRKHLDQLPNFVEHLWATPSVPNGGRSPADEADQVAAKGATAQGKRQIDLGSQARTELWATPRAEHASDSLTGQTKGFQDSLCFRPDPETSPPGGPSSSAGPDSRPLLSMEEIAPTGVWQTPCAGTNRKSERAMQRSVNNGRRSGGGQSSSPGLEQQVEMVGETIWPTPAATPYGSSQNGINGKGGTHERPSANTPGLEKMAQSMTPTSKAKLNPAFVEWLMGLPPGWTAFAPVGMASYHWRRRMRFSLCVFGRSLTPNR